MRLGRRASTIQSAASIAIISILGVIGGVILLLRFPVGAEPFGMQSTRSVSGKTVGIPDIAAPAGYALAGAPERYSSDTLYEKINGKADLYTSAGFSGLTTSRFASAGQPWMECYLYEMNDEKAAFSVYSTQKRPGATELSLAERTPAYITDNAVYLVRGRHYLEIIGSEISTDLLESQVDLATKLVGTLPAGRQEALADLRLLQTHRMVPGSEKLYLDPAFGIKGLEGTFTADYRIGPDVLTAYLSRRADSAAAAAAAAEIIDELLGAGGVISSLPSDTPNVPGVVIVDLFGTYEAVFSGGPFVAGVHEAESKPQSMDLASMLLESIQNGDIERGERP